MIIISLAVLLLFGCSKRLSPKRTDAEQQQVKQQVMKLLEEQYHQSFKLNDFSYEYETDYKYSFFYVQGETSGQYIFKVKSIDNPIIVMNFVINDNKEESINDLILSFKKNQLNVIYCNAFTNYYSDVVNKDIPLQKNYAEKAEKYCDSRNQDEYKRAKNYYFKHESEYK